MPAELSLCTLQVSPSKVRTNDWFPLVLFWGVREEWQEVQVILRYCQVRSWGLTAALSSFLLPLFSYGSTFSHPWGSPHWRHLLGVAARGLSSLLTTVFLPWHRRMKILTKVTRVDPWIQVKITSQNKPTTSSFPAMRLGLTTTGKKAIGIWGFRVSLVVFL